MSYESVWLGLKVNFPFLSYLSVHKNNIQLYDQKKFVHIVEERKESFQRASQPLWWLRSDSCPVMQSPKERLKASSNTHIHNRDRPEPDVFIYASSYTLTHFFLYITVSAQTYMQNSPKIQLDTNWRNTVGSKQSWNMYTSMCVHALQPTRTLTSISENWLQLYK